jgi:hypothetical protein
MLWHDQGLISLRNALGSQRVSAAHQNHMDERLIQRRHKITKAADALAVAEGL